MSQRDTLFRHLAILQMLPRSPHSLSTTTIEMRLVEQGYTMTSRSIQRDLEKLADHFPLECNKGGKPFKWCFVANYNSDLPALDTVTALTLVLAEEAVRGLLPKVAMDKISYKFQSARKHLDGLQGNDFSQWSRKVRAIPNGKSLIPAEIKATIWEGLTDALLNHYAVDVDYLSRLKGELKRYTLHPLGLVTRDSSSYLLATVNDHDDVRQFALHRFRSVTESVSLYRAQPDFDVQRYIDQGAFGFPMEDEPIRLVARIDSTVAWLLSETPLSKDQSLSEPDTQGWVQLEATVPNDQQTRWWVMGFGANIDVIEPLAWREHILEQARSIVGRA
ncbi:MAG: WYL domain-containing protein [Gammaproteobacteria bacterium HGW-Gammaproteobacteria-11]|nr:MAG: WYL domain-containing protein [Gammaproteobacteria bacterium HGW-Gammaproteobacteria-11]